MGNSVNSTILKAEGSIVNIKWRDANVWLLFGVVMVYFSISFSSRIVDYVDQKHDLYHDYRR
ncbi:hypothetical protein Q7M76_00970 [Candidatus Liberibacter asiaticus]|uniref:Uncharacterized protein n=2 Tax=Liberibacter asiaticus TaxID=34021 RepID=C6XHQ4_LIBAP|nr:hypothetical protein [Candidatus Liberibacter asiaticus]ACT56797.1 hypothetical protein CLIBASIA_01045 [Candidatus Liberibacter asiaticus str. psy62]AGH16564.1 hypothetical protein WSI_00960 [Candidatus Liberibacter asiaticus str. gxpsy]ALK06956.1 hypothetical protein CD16_00975 [Candidatus Liberibacter asiaticus]ASK52426.1 hypothetical protein B2I23_01000 [Candidatus Liberibacter asiaticus]AWL14539.1 hypothetical protein DIC79_01010 [Candidatus Liberibacter asiaticus]